MRRKTFYILSVIFVLVLASLTLFSCQKIKKHGSSLGGRVMPVSTAMDAVYASMLRADGSENVNFFTLRCDGTVQNGETLYDFSFNGSFDITQNNRENDTRTVLSFEVKQGGIEKFAFYYKEGEAYLHYPPYALSSKIQDFNLAEIAFEIYAEKKNGVIRREIMIDLLLFYSIEKESSKN